MRRDKRLRDCRRRGARSAFGCKALAFGADGRRVELTVSDISLEGFGFEGSAFAADEEFRLVIPQRGEVDARVRWASEGAAGARFGDDGVLGSWVPARERLQLRRANAFNFGSGRTFGRRGTR